MSVPSIPHNIRALCTDIDGTLLDSRRELSARTLSAIKRIKHKVPVILASSRMPAAMRHLQRDLEILDHPLICFNGGYVLQYTPDAPGPVVLDSVSLPVSVCAAIVALAAEATDVHVSLFERDNWYAPGHDQWTEREARITKVTPTIMPPREVLMRWKETGGTPHKVMCMGPQEAIGSLEILLNNMFAQQIHVYRSKSTYIEIAPKAISKATALADVLKKVYQLDISEAIAFGDNYNDIDLLQSAGWGVAVANAREEVKAVADEITANNKEDGVAIIIEKYFS